MTSRRRLRCSTSHRLEVPSVRLSTVGNRAFPVLVPPSGTSCLSTSHLRRHSRLSDNDSRPFCFPVPIPRHCHLTRVLLSPFITTVWTPVVFAMINIISATSEMFMLMMMMFYIALDLCVISPTHQTIQFGVHHEAVLTDNRLTDTRKIKRIVGKLTHNSIKSAKSDQLNSHNIKSYHDSVVSYVSVPGVEMDLL